MTVGRYALQWILLSGLLAGAAEAQNHAGFGTVAGSVRRLDIESPDGPAGTGAAGAKIILVNSQSGEMRSAVTDEHGEYGFREVPPGRYKLSADLAGFTSDGARDLEVIEAKTARGVIDLYVEIKDNPRLPRILLIGDSISIGYTFPVRTLLQGKANVHRIPDAVGTVRLLPNLERWLGNGKWDLIHFNCGLHDVLFANKEVFAPIDDYERNLKQIVKVLKGTGATLIWASTTPVPEGVRGRKNEDVIAYNAVARRLMAANGIPVDDLYSFALPQLNRIQKPSNVHFTAEGSRVLARRVVDAIQEELGRRTKN